MLTAIGETFETPYTSTSGSSPVKTADLADQVTGVIVSSRKAFYRLNIWTRDSTPAARPQLDHIGKHFKYGVLGFAEGKKVAAAASDKSLASDVEFTSHEASQSRSKGKGWSV